jgi:hypothetical protein
MFVLGGIALLLIGALICMLALLLPGAQAGLAPLLQRDRALLRQEPRGFRIDPGSDRTDGLLAGEVSAPVQLEARYEPRSQAGPISRPRLMPAQMGTEVSAAMQLVLRDVVDSEIELAIRTGHLINAITLYREKTGVGPDEARDVVYAWRDRLRAS